MVTVTFEPATIFKVIAVIAVVGVVYFGFRKAWGFVRKLFGPKLHGLDRKGIGARWDEIEKLVSSGEGMALKMAVMEADKLLDHSLKAMSMSGTTLGERLKFAAYKYPNIRKVWWAHRLRNSLVHEPTFRLEKHTAKKAIKEFKRALQMLGVM